MNSHGQPRSQLQYSMYLPSISQSLAMAAPLARSVMSLFEVAEMSLSDIPRMSLVGTQEAAPPPSPSQSERAFGGEPRLRGPSKAGPQAGSAALTIRAFSSKVRRRQRPTPVTL